MSSSSEAMRLATAAGVIWRRSLAARKLPSRADHRNASTKRVFILNRRRRAAPFFPSASNARGGKPRSAYMLPPNRADAGPRRCCVPLSGAPCTKVDHFRHQCYARECLRHRARARWRKLARVLLEDWYASLSTRQAPSPETPRAHQEPP
ncbi:hypothetical protein G6F31_019284 [Rhizopus arrhizus]|nr:hypothetical protein G6F31_019284 [Rhizopus arrhizus]